MANTTNFGWETPDDTDLVKDGALAMRTLGNAIDTSLVDLKGGTTDQVLAKNSNTDMDFKWVTSDDANAIQNAIVDAKGDLITATAADTPARLAVGTNNFRLVADSGESTGLKWQGFVGVSLYMSANQSIANNTEVKVLFDSEDYDTNGFHSTSSNTSRITIPTGLGGYYLFTANAAWNANAAGNRSMFYKINNTTYYMTWTMPSGVAALDMNLPGSIVIKLNAGDYVELGVYQSSGGALDLEGGINEETRYQATFLGA